MIPSYFRLISLAGLAAVLVVGFGQTTARAQAGQPTLFYSDLTDGPRTGGENNKGAYVCVYGRNFGASRGTSTITVGGVPVDNYPVWGDGIAPARGDSKACFQLGNAAPTGATNLQMTVNGIASNTLPFYVREDAADKIYCVSDTPLPAGSATPSDSNNGHFGKCWASTDAAWMGASNVQGSIIYLHNIKKTTATGPCNGYAWCTQVGGADASHMSAIAAYPGSDSTIGTMTRGMQVNGLHVTVDNYTVAGLTLRAGGYAFHENGAGTLFFQNWRLVGADIQCSSHGYAACVVAHYTARSQILGNLIHDVMLTEPHGYLPTSLPGGGPLDSADSVLISVVSDGSGTCVANSVNSPGDLYVGESDFQFMGGPPGLNGEGYQFGTYKVKAIGANSFTFTCGTVAAGQYTASTNPYMWWTARPKMQHTLYMGTNSTDYEIGWNEFKNNWSNNDINLNSTPENVTNPRNPSGAGTWGVPHPILSTDPQQPGYPLLGTTTGCVSGTCTSNRTYYVSMSWLDSSGNESDASHETAISLAAGERATLSAPPFTIGSQAAPGYLALSGCSDTCMPVKWCVFVGATPKSGTKQGCYGAGISYTEPPTGITTTGTTRLNFATQTAGQQGGYAGTHIFIHDNLIYGGQTAGISENSASPEPTGLYGDDATSGGVYIYNNVIYRQAKGLMIVKPSLVGVYTASDGLGHSTCILLSSAAQNGPTIKGTVHVDNNTCYDVGQYWNNVSGPIVGFLSIGQEPHVQCGAKVTANNNVFVSPISPSLEPFTPIPDYPCVNSLSGEKNLWYNTAAPATPPPAASTLSGDSSCIKSLKSGEGTPCFTNNISADPLFVNPATGDFHLQSTSPAKSGGVNTYPVIDFYGVPRGQNGTYSIGAFELGSSSQSITLIYDLNGDGVIDQKDVDAAVAQLIAGSCGNADINGDHSCNIVDVQLLINAIRAGLR
jgi:hypothetical protein